MFSVYALEKDDGSCDIAELLDIGNSNNKEDGSLRAAMFRRIVALAQGNLLTGSIHHSIEDGIWQVSSGKYRLLYFYDAEHRIICTHYFVKKTDKMPSREIKKAREHRDNYLRAKRENSLIFKD